MTIHHIAMTTELHERFQRLPDLEAHYADAQQQIAALRRENARLRGRVQELEVSERYLQARLMRAGGVTV